LAEHLGVDVAEWTLVEVIIKLAKHIIPEAEMSDALMESILAKRSVSYEDDEDIEKVCEIEYLLDCFDKDERRSLEQEVKDAKDEREQQTAFRNSVHRWKACVGCKPPWAYAYVRFCSPNFHVFFFLLVFKREKQT